MKVEEVIENMNETEICILDVLLTDQPWNDKYRLLNHYKPVISTQAYYFFNSIIFSDMILEIIEFDLDWAFRK